MLHTVNYQFEYFYLTHCPKGDSILDEDPVEISSERINSLFGAKLASLRRGKGVSQTALGRRLSLSRTTIANLERGTQNVQLHQVFAFAQALDADPAILIPKSQELEPNEATPGRLLETLRAKLLERLESEPK